MYETHVTVMGRLVADPETRTTTQGEVFTTFRLATSERRRTREGIFEDGPTSFYNVACYRALGVNTRASLSKGEPVVVVGRQRVRQYQRADDSYGTSVELTAQHVGHDLLLGQSAFVRPGRGEDDAAGDEAARRAYEDSFADESDGSSDAMVDRLTGEVRSARDERSATSAEPDLAPSF